MKRIRFLVITAIVWFVVVEMAWAKIQWIYTLNKGPNIITATTDFKIDIFRNFAVKKVWQVISGQLVLIIPGKEINPVAQPGDIFVVDCSSEISLAVEGNEYFSYALVPIRVEVEGKEYWVLGISPGISITAQQWMRIFVQDRDYNRVHNPITGWTVTKEYSYPDFDLAPGRGYLVEHLPEISVTLHPDSPSGEQLAGLNIRLALFRVKATEDVVLDGLDFDFYLEGVALLGIDVYINGTFIREEINTVQAGYFQWSMDKNKINVGPNNNLLVEVRGDVRGRGVLRILFSGLRSSEFKIIHVGFPSIATELIF